MTIIMIMNMIISISIQWKYCYSAKHIWKFIEKYLNGRR